MQHVERETVRQLTNSLAAGNILEVMTYFASLCGSKTITGTPEGRAYDAFLKEVETKLASNPDGYKSREAQFGLARREVDLLLSLVRGICG